jgi:two-component system response regulator HydG
MKRGYYEIIYERPKMARMIERAMLVAQSDARVLITGESGTGKELLARTIHEASQRRAKNFVTVNCPGLTETLLESELFGHVRGAFTDAREDKIGILERADGGTLLIDEISEASKKLQGIFLRFLETGEIQKVGFKGSVYPIANTRVIAASNRDLDAMVTTQEFRRDLYFRLNVVHFHMPPLRERADDIPRLVNYFINRYSPPQSPRGIEPKAMAFLVDYHWPGNIRQLENLVEGLSAVASNGLISISDVRSYGLEKVDKTKLDGKTLYEAMRRGEGSFWSVVYTPFMMREVNRETVTEVVRLGLEEAKGNYRIVTKLFGIEAADYKRFLNFLRKHDLQLPFKDYRAQ